MELGLHWMLRHQKLQATSKLRTRAVQSLMQWGQVRWGAPWWQQPGVGLAADQEPAPPDLEGGQIHAVGLMSEEGAAVFPSVVEAGQVPQEWGCLEPFPEKGHSSPDFYDAVET